MALGILIAQTRKSEMPDGYFEGLGSFGCVARAEKWGSDLFCALNAWSPDVIVLQHNGGDDGPLAYLDALRQHPLATHTAVGLVLSNDTQALPGATVSQLLLSEDEFADYLRFFACIKRRMDRLHPLLFAAPLACGEILMDPQDRLVQVNGQGVQLSGREFSLLEYLARRPGRTFSRSQLVSALWADVHDPDQRTVDVVVMRIRKTLARLGAEYMIRTVRNKGYRLFSTNRHSGGINTMGPIVKPQSIWGIGPVPGAPGLNA